jgi:hypothetical protein
MTAKDPLAKPEIETEPDDAEVCEDDQVTFTAAATSRLAPAVQWEVSVDGGRSWVEEPGADDPTLTFAAGADQDGHLYRAVFTNRSGSTTTRPATLTVNSPPGITEQPESTAVVAGETASFTAAAHGRPAPTAQWCYRENGAVYRIGTPPPPWASIVTTSDNTRTATSLEFTAQDLDNGDVIWVEFENDCDLVESAKADLTVAPPPATLSPVERSFHQVLDRLADASERLVGTDTDDGQPAPPGQQSDDTETVVREARIAANRLLQDAEQLRAENEARPDVRDAVDPILVELQRNGLVLDAAARGTVDPVQFRDEQDSFRSNVERRLEFLTDRAAAPPPPPRLSLREPRQSVVGDDLGFRSLRPSNDNPLRRNTP